VTELAVFGQFLMSASGQIPMTANTSLYNSACLFAVRAPAWDAASSAHPGGHGGMVREIEVKYHVDDLEALLVVLKARGIELSDPVYQDDQAYAPDGWQFGDSKLGVSFARLRTVDGRHYFAVKQPGENAQACLEYETEVADRAAMHGAILHMGYHPTVRVAKARRTATLERCSLCVDDVEGVGAFLELERMVPDDMPAEAIQAELAAFVAAFGVAAVRTDETYDSLVQAAQASPA
jgi:adenylate cyclase class 2